MQLKHPSETCPALPRLFAPSECARLTAVWQHWSCFHSSRNCILFYTSSTICEMLPASKDRVWHISAGTSYITCTWQKLKNWLVNKSSLKKWTAYFHMTNTGDLRDTEGCSRPQQWSTRHSEHCAFPLHNKGLEWLWDSSGKNTGVGCHSLLQGIFLTQGWNPGLLHGRWYFIIWVTREAPSYKRYVFTILSSIACSIALC